MNSPHKSFIILTPGFAKDTEDTTCIPMQQNFIRKLKEKFPTLNIIILALEYPYVKKKYEWFDNTVLSFNNRNRGGISRIFLRWRVLKELEKIHLKTGISGILSFWYGECALLGKKFADKHLVPHYCWMWGQDAKKGNKYVSKVKLRENDLIAFSDFLQNEFQKNYSLTPQHVIPPGIDIEQLPAPNPNKDIDIIAAGSLIPLKRYDLFINVIAEIKKTFPSVIAVLIGDGPERERLQRLVEKYGLQSNLTLTGELSHPEVLQWMQRSKIFLHPSAYEGFGIVCIEALSAGATVITFVRPMNLPIDNWQIAASKEEMIAKAINLLRATGQEYKAVVPYTIEQTVHRMAELFSL